MKSGTTAGPGPAAPELLVELDRSGEVPLRAQLEDGLREAVRAGRLAPGSRLPPSRALAGDIGVSRRLVVDAYSQLLAEGYLSTRRGDGTYVATSAGPSQRPPAERRARPLQIDFFPGNPDLAGFPRRVWMRVLRETLRDAADRELGYPDPRGAPVLRRALAGHLRRVRGVAADAESIVVCSGAAQAFALLAAALAGSTLAVEDPGMPVHRSILAEHGAALAALPVDADGARVEELDAIGAAAAPDRPLRAAIVTPAHQSPTGVALAPGRRAALLEWAARADALVVEDDYDAEFRFDRAPLGALQGLAPARVAYLGTVSKSLAPALRIGWIVVPSRLLDAVVRRKLLSDHGSATIDQLALARMLDSGAYDRHLRAARRRYRSRRDALAAAVERHLPGARITGLAAGLHATVRLAEPVDQLTLARAAARRSVGVYPLGYAYLEPRPVDDGLVLGYANLAEAAIEEGIRRLAQALAELGPGPAAT